MRDINFRPSISLLKRLLKNMPDKLLILDHVLFIIKRRVEDGLIEHPQIGFVVLIECNDLTDCLVKAFPGGAKDHGVPIEHLEHLFAAEIDGDCIGKKRVRDFLRDESGVFGAFKAQGELALVLEICFAAVLPVSAETGPSTHVSGEILV